MTPPSSLSWLSSPACSQYGHAFLHAATQTLQENTVGTNSYRRQYLVLVKSSGNHRLNCMALLFYGVNWGQWTLSHWRGARYRTEHTVAFQRKAWKSRSIQVKLFQKRKCFIYQNRLMFQAELSLFPGFWGGLGMYVPTKTTSHHQWKFNSHLSVAESAAFTENIYS